MKEEHKK